MASEEREGITAYPNLAGEDSSDESSSAGYIMGDAASPHDRSPSPTGYLSPPLSSSIRANLARPDWGNSGTSSSPMQGNDTLRTNAVGTAASAAGPGPAPSTQPSSSSSGPTGGSGDLAESFREFAEAQRQHYASYLRSQLVAPIYIPPHLQLRTPETTQTSQTQTPQAPTPQAQTPQPQTPQPPTLLQTPQPPSRQTQMPQSQTPQDEQDVILPRWQPDAEVTFCPICHAQFSIFIRKHHCRKCGRVVCGACSPHRIIIPYQYIVRPPNASPSQQPATVVAAAGGLARPGSVLAPNAADSLDRGGGERVRLCNPCVPDPNTAPPLQLTAAIRAPASNTLPRIHSQSLGNNHGAASGNRYGYVGSNPPPEGSVPVLLMQGWLNPNYDSRRSYSGIGNQTSSNRTGFPTSFPGGQLPYQSRLPREQEEYNRERLRESEREREREREHATRAAIREEDECPVCRRELPSISLPNGEALREQHISQCIEAFGNGGRRSNSHSGVSGPSGQSSPPLPPPPPRGTGMFPYRATEKDCVDDAECTICLEEFVVGVQMARLECFCRFHEKCIRLWFQTRPGRCPVHQHDSYGF